MMSHHTLPQFSSQRGSAFFYILLAVVLLAALAFAIASSLRGNSSFSSENTKVLASDVIASGTRMKEAVDRLKLRGVAENALSFENSFVAGYANATCTTNACKIFNSEGGGLGDETPTSGILTGSYNWGFTGNVSIMNVGTNAKELIAFLPGISAEVCGQINKLTRTDGATVTPSLATWNSVDKYTGSYNFGPTVAVADFVGVKSGCGLTIGLNGTAVTGSPLANVYTYYVVLIAN